MYIVSHNLTNTRQKVEQIYPLPTSATIQLNQRPKLFCLFRRTWLYLTENPQPWTFFKKKSQMFGLLLPDNQRQ